MVAPVTSGTTGARYGKGPAAGITTALAQVSLAGGTAATRNETADTKANAVTTVRFPVNFKVRPIMGLDYMLHFYRRMASKIKAFLRDFTVNRSGFAPLSPLQRIRVSLPKSSTTISRASMGTTEVVTLPPGQRTQRFVCRSAKARTCTALSCDQ